ncbi:MAG: hypothetical protein ACFFDU_00090 [Candidatus Thorarchaeota archaeon]
MHFITKILNDSVDQSVHRAFLRYGRGEYPGPAAEVTVTKAGAVKVRSSYMYQDLPASVMVETMPVETVAISGLILGYEPLDEVLANLGFDAAQSKKKPRTLLYQSKLTGKYPTEPVSKLYSGLDEIAYIFCSLKTNIGWEHKAKTKIPSAQKEPPVTERLKFSNTKVPEHMKFLQALLSQLLPDFIDDVPSGFSKLQIMNTYEIQDLIFPPNMKQLASKEVRSKTKRSGILRRTLIVDDTEFTNKHPMTV